MLDTITNMLRRCDSDKSVIPPTTLYNEGWMLRLVFDWLDRNRGVSHPLLFMPGARWYSEALLPSRFLPQSRSDPKAETFTHADGVIGHFVISPGIRGDVKILPGAKQFVVVEAKLASGLSGGTKNAPNYDQAARTVACIAHLLTSAEVKPASVDSLAFYVLAPEAQIGSGIFKNLVNKESIEKKVKARIEMYDGKHSTWFEESFIPTLTQIMIDILAWEAILAEMPTSDEVELLREFYTLCLHFNLLRANQA